MRFAIAILVFALALSASLSAANRNNHASSASPVIHSSAEADQMRVLGEQRYRANCSRCHAAPQKFPPRMMPTILRHMRVRALITDEDMRLVLFYMSQ